MGSGPLPKSRAPQKQPTIKQTTARARAKRRKSQPLRLCLSSRCCEVVLYGVEQVGRPILGFLEFIPDGLPPGRDLLVIAFRFRLRTSLWRSFRWRRRSGKFCRGHLGWRRTGESAGDWVGRTVQRGRVFVRMKACRLERQAQGSIVRVGYDPERVTDNVVDIDIFYIGQLECVSMHTKTMTHEMLPAGCWVHGGMRVPWR